MMEPREAERSMPPNYLVGKTVSIFGYSSEGLVQAQILSSQGVRVVVSVREGYPICLWEEAGFHHVSMWEAVEVSDVFQVW